MKHQNLVDRAMKLLVHGHSCQDILLQQYATAEVKREEDTGTGFFIVFSSTDGVEWEKTNPLNFELGEVDGCIAQRMMVGFIVFIRNGYLEAFEAYTYGDDWPVDDDIVLHRSECGVKKPENCLE